VRLTSSDHVVQAECLILQCALIVVPESHWPKLYEDQLKLCCETAYFYSADIRPIILGSWLTYWLAVSQSCSYTKSHQVPSD
jgi:hypothetical protein